MHGSSHARRVIQRVNDGDGFFADDEVVRLDVETVDATDAAVVVRVWGIAVCDDDSATGC